jgi:hypothetical protein
LHYSASVGYAWVITQLLGQLKEAQLIYVSASQLGHTEVKNTAVTSQIRNVTVFVMTYKENKGQSYISVCKEQTCPKDKNSHI